MVVVISIFALIIISALGYFVWRDSIKKKSLSFRDSLNLVGLPVVTFYSGHRKLNMLLDTGSSDCILNAAALDSLVYEEKQYLTPIMGMEGNTTNNKVISTTISYSGLKFPHEFVVVDMSQAFGEIKKESGVTIHGILGSDFFSRYKYILDFDELMFYKK